MARGLWTMFALFMAVGMAWCSQYDAEPWKAIDVVGAIGWALVFGAEMVGVRKWGR